MRRQQKGLQLIGLAVLLTTSCNSADDDPRKATPSKNVPRVVQQDAAAQMAAFDQLVRDHGVIPPDGPEGESHGVLYDLDFLINKGTDDLDDFFRVATGPVRATRNQLPWGLWRFWIVEAQLTYDVYVWETDASRMGPEYAPSDLLMIAVANGRIIGYTFRGHYIK